MCVCMSSPDQNIILEHGSIHHFKTGATTRDRSIDQFVVVLVAAVFKRGDDTTVKTLDYKRKVARNLRKKPTKNGSNMPSDKFLNLVLVGYVEFSIFSTFRPMTSPQQTFTWLYCSLCLWFDSMGDYITSWNLTLDFDSFVAMRLHAFLCQKELSMSKSNTCYEYIYIEPRLSWFSFV